MCVACHILKITLAHVHDLITYMQFAVFLYTYIQYTV